MLKSLVGHRVSRVISLLVPALALLAGARIAEAATVTALSCSATDVQAAITAAVNLDQVTVPAGVCTWTSSVTVPSGKNLTIQGAGVAATVITLDGALGDYLRLGTTATRVTGIEWRLMSGDRIISARGQGFRIDHNMFVNSVTPIVNRVAVYVSGGTGIPHPTGVIDHNTFLDCRTYLQADLRLLAHDIWADVSKIGNTDQTGVLYVEDNDIRYAKFLGNAMDGQFGARYVFRHNRVTNSLVEVHSVQGNDRGSRSWEIYNNTFSATVSVFTAMFIRAGTGVAFDNVITGTYYAGMKLDNVRSFQADPVPAVSGVCNGLSIWDGNLVAGWPCRDQIGRSTDEFLWTTVPTPPGQASEPAYFWGNTLNGTSVAPDIHNCTSGVKPYGSCADIQMGRDYLNGIVRPGYTAYAYPHPLQSLGATALAPPSKLEVKR